MIVQWYVMNFQQKQECNILDSGSNEEDFGNEKGDCSTEDEDDCYDGNLVDIDKDLDDSRDLQVEMHTK